MAFVFFDTETTGLNAGFDQLIQFAAIKTDHNLSEIDRFEMRSKIKPDVVPHFEAMLANGMSIQELTDRSLRSHYQMMREVNSKLLSWSPSIFLGYNSIRFDEEFLRQSFFQTLHPPYLTSLHGNGRNDILSLTLACHAVGDDALVIPSRDDGRPSFRLEDLCAANGVNAIKAHDAMSDAETALTLCRLIKERNSSLWQRFVRFSKKAAVVDFVSSQEAFILTEFFANQAYHTPVVFIANEPDQPNRMLCLNLDYGADVVSSWTDQQLLEELSHKPSPIRIIRTNAGPTMTPLWEAPENLFGGAEVDGLEERAANICDNGALKQRIVAAYLETRIEYPKPTYVEEMIYSEFPSGEDEARCRQFHNAPWHERFEIVKRIDDHRLREFGMRLVHFEARSTLPKDDALRMDIELAQRLNSPDSKPWSLVQALAQIDEKPSVSEDDQEATQLLYGFRVYLMDRKSKVDRFLEGV